MAIPRCILYFVVTRTGAEGLTGQLVSVTRNDGPDEALLASGELLELRELSLKLGGGAALGGLALGIEELLDGNAQGLREVGLLRSLLSESLDPECRWPRPSPWSRSSWPIRWPLLFYCRSQEAGAKSTSY